MIPLKRAYTLSRTIMEIFGPKLGVYNIYIYIYIDCDILEQDALR